MNILNRRARAGRDRQAEGDEVSGREARLSAPAQNRRSWFIFGPLTISLVLFLFSLFLHVPMGLVLTEGKVIYADPYLTQEMYSAPADPMEFSIVGGNLFAFEIRLGEGEFPDNFGWVSKEGFTDNALMSFIPIIAWIFFVLFLTGISSYISSQESVGPFTGDWNAADRVTWSYENLRIVWSPNLSLGTRFLADVGNLLRFVFTKRSLAILQNTVENLISQAGSETLSEDMGTRIAVWTREFNDALMRFANGDESFAVTRVLGSAMVSLMRRQALKVMSISFRCDVSAGWRLSQRPSSVPTAQQPVSTDTLLTGGAEEEVATPIPVDRRGRKPVTGGDIATLIAQLIQLMNTSLSDWMEMRGMSSLSTREASVIFRDEIKQFADAVRAMAEMINAQTGDKRTAAVLAGADAYAELVEVVKQGANKEDGLSTTLAGLMALLRNTGSAGGER